jgi:high-affinity iron transporter
MAAFLVMLREGVEAALIVAILLSYLRRVGGKSESRAVWWGTGIAAALSLAAGVVVFATVGSLEGAAEEATEGVIALVAAGVLTWMIFWMGRQARAIRGQLQVKVDIALAGGGMLALALVAFSAVLREGLESALFLISTTIGEEASSAQLVGGLAGVLAAIGIGYLVYRGGNRLNLRLFFRVTGALIILFAAGLVSTGIHEFQELGLIPNTVEHLWSLSFADPETSLFWRFMRSMFGWRPDPSLLMVIGYFAYIVPVGWSFLRATGVKPVSAPVPAT